VPDEPDEPPLSDDELLLVSQDEEYDDDVSVWWLVVLHELSCAGVLLWRDAPIMDSALIPLAGEIGTPVVKPKINPDESKPLCSLVGDDAGDVSLRSRAAPALAC